MGSQYDNGATQQISQSIHDAIIRRSRSERLSTPSHPSSAHHQHHDENTQFSLAEGDEGHIDITSSFAQLPVVPNDESLAFSPTQTQPPLTQFPESQRFKTPATAGRKRNYDGEVVDTPTVQSRNPLLLFAEAGPASHVLGLSQAFAATQAGSSPVGNGLTSEMRSDRPSPNVGVLSKQQGRVSSPLLEYISAEIGAVERTEARFEPLDYGGNAEKHTMSNVVVQMQTDTPSRDVRATAGKDQAKLKNASRDDPVSSASIPSSPPLLNQIEDSTTRLARHDSVVVTTTDKSKTDLATSSANKDINMTVIPDTLKRMRTSLPHGQVVSGPSPLAKTSQFVSTQQPDQDTLHSTATTQPALYFTQLSTVSEGDHTRFDKIDRVSASPEKELETTQQATQMRDTATRNPHSSLAVPETSSNSVQMTVNNPPENPLQPPASATSRRAQLEDDSSQPVRATPPGRKRRVQVLDDEVDDFGTPVQTQVDTFDARTALALDEDANVAELLVNTPKSSPIITSKRRKTRLVASPPEVSLEKVRTSVRQLSPVVEPRKPYSFPQGKRQIVPEVAFDHEDLPSPTPRAVSNVMAAEEPLQTPPRTTRPSIYDTMPSPVEVRRPSRLRAPRTQPESEIESQSSKPAPGSPVPPVLPSTMPSLPAPSSDMNITATPAETCSRPAPDPSHMVAPNMIFAYYFGRIRAYYPAECLSISADGLRYTIRWTGYDAEEMNESGVCALDLRVGDHVKVEAKGFGKTPYVITGFKTVASKSSTESATDVYGHTHVTVVPRQKHELLGKQQRPSQQEVAVADVYLDSNMWTKMRKRKVVMKTIKSIVNKTGTSTPSIRASTPSTPPSRTRQLLEESSFHLPDTTGIFTNMAFALSVEDDRARDSITTMIKNHGGAIIRNSFQELFDEQTDLRPQTRQLGFVALISDRHSRKEKYMQALALNLPCLSKKWVEASVARDELADWADYLLPAGESLELDGAIRSRRLAAYRAENARLVTILTERHNFFLNSHCVFIFATGTKKAEARRNTHLILARMMGARSVDVLHDLATAEQLMLKMENRKVWLLVDDREVSAARDVRERLMSRRRKSRRTARVDPGLTGEGEAEITIMDPESMMQSLILGRFCAGH